MGIATIVKDVVSGIAAPVVDAYKVNQDRKSTREQAELKLKTAKLNGQKELALTDAEWESILANKTDSTWKDEYVTIVITSPIVLFLLGGIISVTLNITAPMDAITTGITAIKDLGVDMGELMIPVVWAAVGLKAIKTGLK